MFNCEIHNELNDNAHNDKLYIILYLSILNQNKKLTNLTTRYTTVYTKIYEKRRN